MNFFGHRIYLYDKFLHVLAGGVIASFVATVATQFGVSQAHALAYGFGASLAAGLGKEALDWLSFHYSWADRLHAWLFHEPTGDVSVSDFLCTVVAGAMACLLTWWIQG